MNALTAIAMVETAYEVFDDRCQRLEVVEGSYAFLCLSKREVEMVVEVLGRPAVDFIGARTLRVDLERMLADLAALEKEEDED